MSADWRNVRLAEIAAPVSRLVPVLAGTQYRTIGVKWWGEGAYERQTIDGSQTAAETLSMVRQGDLIINKIWVRHGSTAIASEAVDGCAASNEFPTFELKQNLVLPRWIHWLAKTRTFWGKCDALSRGTSGKNRIKPELFLTIEIPLPSLEEQRRIAAYLDDLQAKVDALKKLQAETATELDALLPSILDKAFKGEL
jgi:type I restriction enzyme S subunit